MRDPDLWHRIAAVQVDVDGRLAKTLSREEHWTRQKAQQAVREGRRWIYLSRISGNQVTPPYAVARVWAALLRSDDTGISALTEGVVLDPDDKPMDRGFFTRRYMRTIKLYETEFREYPPQIIWPHPLTGPNFFFALGFASIGAAGVWFGWAQLGVLERAPIIAVGGGLLVAFGALMILYPSLKAHLPHDFPRVGAGYGDGGDGGAESGGGGG